MQMSNNVYKKVAGESPSITNQNLETGDDEKKLNG